MPQKYKIEKTTSYQLENMRGDYCFTGYSFQDTKLAMQFAKKIPNLVCLRKGHRGKQPKGHYLYKSSFPIAESYDIRLHRKMLSVKHKLTGDK